MSEPSHANRIEFKNCRGERLIGLLHGKPNGVLAVSCHGMLGTKDGLEHVLLAEELLRVGVSTLRFDFAGLGESEGRLYDLCYSGEVEDLQAAIEHFAAQGIERFALFGSSMGGAVAYLTAARDERIVAVATLGAPGHLENLDEMVPEFTIAWRNQGYADTLAGRIGRHFYDDALQHDVLAAVRVLRVPILVVHGDADTLVPASDAHDIASTARTARLELVAGADHAFANPQHLRPAMRDIARFLAAALA